MLLRLKENSAKCRDSENESAKYRLGAPGIDREMDFTHMVKWPGPMERPGTAGQNAVDLPIAIKCVSGLG